MLDLPHIPTDIDECAQQGDPYGNHCHLKNTRCVNTNGSYFCECKPGYRRIDKFSCSEVDECATGKAICHEHADCINTPGSYRCRCKEGYSGNGFDCMREYYFCLSFASMCICAVFGSGQLGLDAPH